ncbi:MAG: hypothetical protein ACYC3X_08685 [Pirellulaceae bacterium]
MQRVSQCFLASLSRHEILPETAAGSAPPVTAHPAGDLLPLLIAAWQSACEQRGHTGRKRWIHRLLAWLEQEHRGGGALTRSVPGAQRRVQEWVGERLVWWPRGVPPREWVAIVSSRLGRLEKLDRHWFAALRQVCSELTTAQQVLISARETALAELLERCAQLHRTPLMPFELARPGLSPARWLSECVTRDVTPLRTVDLCWPAIVSPPLHDISISVESIPARDAMVIAASDRTIACHVRRGGNISRLLERRLAEPRPRTGSPVVIIVGEGFVAPGLASEFKSQGAVLREITPRPEPRSQVNAIQPPDSFQPPAQILALEDVKRMDYLSHCTRGADGPWPDQSRTDYLDSLLLCGPDATHSALATLARLVRQRRLLATGRAIRGATPVVCFTAVAIAAIGKLRTFRAHRTRWDFEPYGISIAKEWLIERGARPVAYGDEAVWKQLAESQRPYFQRRWSGRDQAIDWSVEREWRHLGTLSLAELPPDAAFVFVPTRAEAARISVLSLWPVVVVS